MKWLVNVESSQESKGGQTFAQWLAQASNDQGSNLEIQAMHHRGVDREGMMHLHASRLDQANDAVELASGALQTTYEVEQLYQALQHAALDCGDAGLIVPREAPRDGFHLVRLGPLARRVHAMSQVPFMVVPPDLQMQEIGSGPIIAATDLGFESLVACEAAATLAKVTGRSLTVVYVAQVGEFLLGPGAEHWPPPRLLPEDNPTHPFQRLRRWVQDHHIQADALDLLVGHSGEAIVEYAALEFSPLVVTGRRRSGPIEKILRRSTSAYLCGHSACATLVVPTQEFSQAEYRQAA